MTVGDSVQNGERADLRTGRRNSERRPGSEGEADQRFQLWLL